MSKCLQITKNPIFSCIYKGFDNIPTRILVPKLGLFQAFSSQITEKFPLSWARSTKTRIETEIWRLMCCNPLNSWARSTKTRIETSKGCAWIQPTEDSWARSTKTRIETFFLVLHSQTFICIREQDPLKQGLKLVVTESHVPCILIREQDPLKQGLKLHVLVEEF